MNRLAETRGEATYTAPDYPQGVCHIRKAAELPTAVQCAARAVLQDKNCQCAGSRGKAPCVLLGDLKGDILSRERMSPFARFPASGGENHSRFGPQKRRDHLSVVPNFLQLAEALRNDRRRVSGRQRTGVKVKIIPLRRAPGLVGVALVILAALLVHLAD